MHFVNTRHVISHRVATNPAIQWNSRPTKLGRSHRISFRLANTFATRQKLIPRFGLCSSTTEWQVFRADSLCLSRGLTLFLEPTKRETSLKQSHGLQVCDWGQELSNGLTGIGNLRTRLTKGLFHDLLLATDNKFYFRSNSSTVNWSIGAHIPPLGSEFTLEEVAARIPDVASQYKAWVGEALPFMVLKSLKIDHEHDLIEFAVSEKDSEKIESVFPVESFPSRSVTGDGATVVVACRRSEESFFAQRVGIWDIGDVVLYRPLESHLYFTPLAACFVLSFVLGMLCRYFPTTWINIGRSEKGDAFYPLATRLLDWIQDMFPAMVVDVLRGPYDFEAK